VLKGMRRPRFVLMPEFRLEERKIGKVFHKTNNLGKNAKILLRMSNKCGMIAIGKREERQYAAKFI